MLLFTPRRAAPVGKSGVGRDVPNAPELSIAAPNQLDFKRPPALVLRDRDANTHRRPGHRETKGFAQSNLQSFILRGPPTYPEKCVNGEF